VTKPSTKPIPEPELPWSWHKSPGWKEQLERTKRWLTRVEKATHHIDKEDFLYAFYQNCFHIRDWLEEVISKGDLNSFIETTEELRLCADICNVTKHFSLSKPPWQGRELSIAREYVGHNQGWFEPDSRLVALSQGEKHDLLQLGRKCIDAWERFIVQQGLTNDNG